MRVELRDIKKRFGTVRANDGISLVAEAGTVRGLLGENGAGKSTLMKILSGFLRPESGQVLLDGRPVGIDSPRDAVRLGIGMLHQDPLDFPTMTALDNFLLGSPGWVPSRRPARAAFHALAGRLGFPLDPEASCGALTVGERQQLEIVRLLWLGARVLILDEPTSAISAPQRTKLFAALRAMADDGKVVFFVSHKLEEVQQLCDRVTVLRHGRVAGEIAMPADARRLVALMFGREPAAGRRAPAAPGPPAIELARVTTGAGRRSLAGVSLSVRASEVIGLAGLEGSGQRELLRACAGLVRPLHGRVVVGGRTMTGRSYRDFLAAGIAYVPAGRLGEALVPGLTIAEHVALANPAPTVLVDWRAEDAAAARRIEQFNIRGTPSTPVHRLSGGNQQRLVLALLPDDLRALLVEHPTRGLDVESAAYLWNRLLERRAAGTAVVFSSADLDELLARSNRIVVCFSGTVSAPLDARRTTVEQLGALIGGVGV